MDFDEIPVGQPHAQPAIPEDAPPESSGDNYASVSTHELLCSTRDWKARRAGFERIILLQQQQQPSGDSSSSSSSIVVDAEVLYGLLPKLVKESNQVALEAMVEAISETINNGSTTSNDHHGVEAAAPPSSNHDDDASATTTTTTAARIAVVADSVLGMLIERALLSPKPKVVNAASFILRSIIRGGKGPALLSQAQTLLSFKNPKVRSKAATTLQVLLEEVGIEALPKKEFFSSILPLFKDIDPKVRKEAVNICALCYKQSPSSVRNVTSELRESQQAELHKVFETIDANRECSSDAAGEPLPTVADPSQQVRTASSNSNNYAAQFKRACSPVRPVRFLSSFPREFFQTALDKSLKWQERAEGLNSNLIPKLAQIESISAEDDYVDFVKFLKELVCDRQLPLEQAGYRALTELCRGLGSGFHRYARFVIPALFDKFKDKKTSGPAMRVLLAVFESRAVTVEFCSEYFEECLTSKVPYQRLAGLDCIGKFAASPRSTAAELKGALSRNVAALVRTASDDKADVREMFVTCVQALLEKCGPNNSFRDVLAEVDEKVREKILAKFASSNTDVVGHDSDERQQQPLGGVAAAAAMACSSSPPPRIQQKIVCSATAAITSSPLMLAQSPTIDNVTQNNKALASAAAVVSAGTTTTAGSANSNDDNSAAARQQQQQGRPPTSSSSVPRSRSQQLLLLQQQAMMSVGRRSSSSASNSIGNTNRASSNNVDGAVSSSRSSLAVHVPTSARSSVATATPFNPSSSSSSATAFSHHNHHHLGAASSSSPAPHRNDDDAAPPSTAVSGATHHHHHHKVLPPDATELDELEATGWPDPEHCLSRLASLLCLSENTFENATQSKEWRERADMWQTIVDALRMQGDEVASNSLDPLVGWLRASNWKEIVFQVLNATLSAIQVCLQSSGGSTAAAATSFVTPRIASFIIHSILSRWGDPKVRASVGPTLSLLAEHLGLNTVARFVCLRARQFKIPKVTTEVLEWLELSVREFQNECTSSLDVDFLVGFVLGYVFDQSQAAVRTAGVRLIATLLAATTAPALLPQQHRIRSMLATDINPHLMQSIDEEVAKRSGLSDPVMMGASPRSVRRQQPQQQHHHQPHFGSSSSSNNNKSNHQQQGIMNNSNNSKANNASSEPIIRPSPATNPVGIMLLEQHHAASAQSSLVVEEQQVPSSATHHRHNNNSNSNSNGAATNAGFGVGDASFVVGADGAPVPRYDISHEVRPLVTELAHGKEWRDRLNALKKIEKLVATVANTHIQSAGVTELLKACKQRLEESNKNFVYDVLRVMHIVAKAAGPVGSRAGAKLVLPSVLPFLADQKPQLRDEALALGRCLFEAVGIDTLISDLVRPLSQAESQYAKAGLLELIVHQLETDLESLKFKALSPFVNPLLKLLTDRSIDVRSHATALLSSVVYNCGGTEPLYRALNASKPADALVLQPLIEKAAASRRPVTPPPLPAPSAQAQRRERHEDPAAAGATSAPAGGSGGGGDVAASTAASAMERVNNNSINNANKSTSPAPQQQNASSSVPSSAPQLQQQQTVFPPRLALSQEQRKQTSVGGGSAPVGESSSSASSSKLSTQSQQQQHQLQLSPRSHYNHSIANSSGGVITAETIVAGMTHAHNAGIEKLCTAVGSFVEQQQYDQLSSRLVLALLSRLRNESSVRESAFDPDVVGSLLGALLACFSVQEFATTLDSNFLFQMVGNVLDLLQCSLLTSHPSQVRDRTLIRGVNSLTLKMIRNTCPESIFEALMTRLMCHCGEYLELESVGESTRAADRMKHVETVIRCLLRVDLKTVEVDCIISGIHEFLNRFPPSQFRNRNDLPIRSVKLLLGNLCQQVDGDLVKARCMSLVGPSSLVCSFVYMCLDQLKQDKEKNNNSGSSSSSSSPVPVPAMSPVVQPQQQQQQHFGRIGTPTPPPAPPPSAANTVARTANRGGEHHHHHQRNSLERNPDAAPTTTGSPSPSPAPQQQQQQQQQHYHQHQGENARMMVTRFADPSPSSAVTTACGGDSGGGGGCAPALAQQQQQQQQQSQQAARSNSRSAFAERAPNTMSSSSPEKGPSASAMLPQMFAKARKHDTTEEGVSELASFVQKHSRTPEFIAHYDRCSEAFRMYLDRRIDRVLSSAANGV